MKRIIRLTESDLTRIVKRVINEQLIGPSGADNFEWGHQSWESFMDVNRDNGTLKLVRDHDCEVRGDWTGNELKILSGTVFKKGNDELVAKGVTVKWVGDFIGGSKGHTPNATVRISCGTQFITVDGFPKTYFGENWNSLSHEGVRELCKNIK
jgi:hypothetical protein